MADAKTCPKCSGTMTQGRIMKLNEYTMGGKYMYLFAPDNEPGPSLAKSAPGTLQRKALVAFCCDQCGFTEFYGQNVK